MQIYYSLLILLLYEKHFPFLGSASGQFIATRPSAQNMIWIIMDLVEMIGSK